MKVWYFNNEDCSGLFSSKEKALESLRKEAERCEWTYEIIEYPDEDFIEVKASYDWDGTVHTINDVYIVGYELDEDHFS